MPDRQPLVAVLLGTDHHPFHRLVEWSRRLRADGTADWFIQHGTTPLPPGLRGSRMLAVRELEDLLERADAVVTHGGPGLIMEARAAGHRPVVVPRDPGQGEHVDAHQQLFSARLARDSLVTVAHDVDDLRQAVAEALAADRERGLGPGRDGGVAAATRLGELVDALVQSG